MFSPIKVIAALALATAIGSVMFISQPFDRQGGSVPGAEDAVVGESTGVTGYSTCRPRLGGTLHEESMPYSVTDLVLACQETASDPRVEGDSTVAITIEGWGEGLRHQDPTNTITWNDYELKGPEGTWSGRGYGFYDATGDGHLLTIATGSGAYEGLTYMQSFTVPAGGASSRTVGLIQAGSPPPFLSEALLASPASE